MTRISRASRLSLAVMVALGVAVPATPGQAVTDPFDELPTSEEMKRALITPEEIAPAYQQSTQGGGRDTVYLTTAEACARNATNGHLVDYVMQDFKHYQGPTIIEQRVAAVGSEQALDMIAAYVGMVRKCPSRRVGPGMLTISRWKGPRLGDASVGLLYERTGSTGQLVDRDITVLVAHGAVVLTMQHLNNQNSGDEANFRSTLLAAAAKLDEIG
ncbi:hypothetical protein AB0F72_30860 [Actinoplanes sp. NPDC023936]|uniref:hypothetical protein n=1 Tax=Actinoplanes sp. NPDC023936 TaxID=3154910 RepID=UPI0034048863